MISVEEQNKTKKISIKFLIYIFLNKYFDKTLGVESFYIFFKNLTGGCNNFYSV